jgi:hypothetical protein
MMEEMAVLRDEGRAQAWALYHKKFMLSSYLFLDAGLASPKDITAVLLDVEAYRKSEQGSQLLPGDFLERWLSESDEPKKKVKAN